MNIQRILACAALLALPALAQQPKIYNTVKTKLKEGKQVIGGTVLSADPEIYCAMANSGFDYMWIEMQHSPLNFHEVANMLRACKGSSAIPFIRVPDATEGDIQKATDIGALGIILPMVESVEKVKNAVKFAKYPPIGARSQGNGQYGVLWGADYRQTANDNIMIVAMIESPKGVEIASQIADIPGVDVVFVASTDLGSFSGLKQGDPKYEALVKRIHDATLKSGLKLGGPHAWLKRPDFHFFQSSGESGIIRAGVQSILAAEQNKKAPGKAEIEGSEK
ncbi:MAG: aldolase/citrate lyase family protein [Paludibaculum sp.]